MQAMNQNAIYRNLYSDIDFDRKDLFALIREKFLCSNVLYPGCSVHITPSFVFQHVVFVDKSRYAMDFFADKQAVLELIEMNRIYKTSPYCRFLSCDYKAERLPLEDMNFDLAISLYADNVINFCKRYVREKGIILSNNFHDEVLEAMQKHKDLILIGYVRKNKNKYILYDDNPAAALKHRDEEKIQKLCMKNRNGSMRYEDHETYYVLQVTKE